MIKDDGTYIWLDILVDKTKKVTVEMKDEAGNKIKEKIEKPDGYYIITTRFSKSAIGLISAALVRGRKLKTRSSFYDKTTDGFYTANCSVEELHRHTKNKPVTGFKVGK